VPKSYISVYGYSPICVNRVFRLATGLHRVGQTRVQLCGLVEFEVWTSSGSTQLQIAIVV